ncbi:MAG: Smr/MutS family protein [Deltaproteobacteria bacterium]
MKDFWIGDQVKMISSGRTGVYEGIQDGKARVRTGNKFILTSHKNLEKLPEKEIEIDIFDEVADYSAIKLSKEKFKNQIDLHIEKLDPGKQNHLPEMILDFQLKSAREYIEKAISKRIFSVLIIHGKGNGALRLEIEHLLGDFPQVFYYSVINEGGATEIIFKYY